jgi:hypothetical protein
MEATMNLNAEDSAATRMALKAVREDLLDASSVIWTVSQLPATQATEERTLILAARKLEHADALLGQLLDDAEVK